jgi:hypothetical protein
MDQPKTFPVTPPAHQPLKGGPAPTAQGSAESAAYFTTSPVKLAVMSVCTLGLYEVYWFYKNWTVIKQRDGRNIMPFWRGVFAPLFIFSLFKDFNDRASRNGVTETLQTSALGIAYIGFLLFNRAPDPLWLGSLLTFIPLIIANRLALSINRTVEPTFKNNESFSAWNIVAVVVGGLLVGLATYDTFFPSDPL